MGGACRAVAYSAGLGGAEYAHREVFLLVNTHLLCRMKLRVVAVACEITHERKTVCSKSASGIRTSLLTSTATIKHAV